MILFSSLETSRKNKIEKVLKASWRIISLTFWLFVLARDPVHAWEQSENKKEKYR